MAYRHVILPPVVGAFPFQVPIVITPMTREPSSASVLAVYLTVSGTFTVITQFIGTPKVTMSYISTVTTHRRFL